MRDFTFENSTKVYFGKNSIENNLAKELKKYGPNILLGYGRNSIKKSGLYDKIKSILLKEGKVITEFSDIMENPTYDKVLEGANLVSLNQIDLILAVGGGSVMDCCKAVSIVSNASASAWEDFWMKRTEVNFDPIPLGMIPTIAASGSEVNGGAVITNKHYNIKTDIDYPEFNPKFSILDPNLLMTLSKEQLASSGFDIFTHLFEAYLSDPDKSNVTDDVIISLMKSLFVNMRKLINNKCNYEALSNLMWISSLAEIRITKMGKELNFQAHNIEHQLSAYTNCNHGMGLAVIFPSYCKFVYKSKMEKFRRFSLEVLGAESSLDTESACIFAINAITVFINELGLPSNLRQLGIIDKQIISKVAKTTIITEESSKIFSREKIEELLFNSY